jgi:hypothetical protein
MLASGFPDPAFRMAERSHNSAAMSGLIPGGGVLARRTQAVPQARSAKEALLDRQPTNDLAQAG